MLEFGCGSTWSPAQRTTTSPRRLADPSGLRCLSRNASPRRRRGADAARGREGRALGFGGRAEPVQVNQTQRPGPSTGPDASPLLRVSQFSPESLDGVRDVHRQPCTVNPQRIHSNTYLSYTWWTTVRLPQEHSSSLHDLAQLGSFACWGCLVFIGKADRGRKWPPVRSRRITEPFAPLWAADAVATHVGPPLPRCHLPIPDE